MQGQSTARPPYSRTQKLNGEIVTSSYLVNRKDILETFAVNYKAAVRHAFEKRELDRLHLQLELSLVGREKELEEARKGYAQLGFEKKSDESTVMVLTKERFG